MEYNKMLSEIVRKGMDAGYEPAYALNVFDNAQFRMYNKIKHPRVFKLIKLDLDQRAYDLASRYFKVYNIK